MSEDFEIMLYPTNNAIFLNILMPKFSFELQSEAELY